MEKLLQECGLSLYESRVIISLISSTLNIRSLSKKANIPFGKIYSIVKSLKGKELIKESNSRPKLVYVENASKIIGKLIEEKERKNKEVIEALQQVALEKDNAQGSKSRFLEIGTTVEDNAEIQLKVFNEARKEVAQIINVYHKPQVNRKNKLIWEKAIVDAVKRGVKFKAIYPNSVKLPVILKNLKDKKPLMFEVRRMDTNFVRCDIIDDGKVLIKLVHEDPFNFGGVILLENKRFAENLKKVFNNFG